MDCVTDKNRSRGSFVLYDSVSICYAEHFFEEEVQHSFVRVAGTGSFRFDLLPRRFLPAQIARSVSQVN